MGREGGGNRLRSGLNFEGRGEEGKSADGKREMKTGNDRRALNSCLSIRQLMINADCFQVTT